MLTNTIVIVGHVGLGEFAVRLLYNDCGNPVDQDRCVENGGGRCAGETVIGPGISPGIAEARAPSKTSTIL